jgi:small conductance mechanosensitive channel
MNNLADLFEMIFNLGKLWLPFSITIVFGISLIFVFNKLLNWNKKRSSSEPIINYDAIFFILCAILIVSLIFVLPISDQSRGQILNLIGILFTAAIALSSTTLMGNAMAGLMLKLVGRFKGGDFLEIDEHFGRVTERGFFHVEIQTEDRDLKTLSNLYLIKTPFKVIYQAGTIISAHLSLGYDVSSENVIEKLKTAALEAGLTDPFVQVMELGDYSITYRAAGFLKEVKYLISARSKLRLSILNVLHRENIEIVSPRFMNQRVFDTQKQFIPKNVNTQKEQNLAEHGLLEGLVFDKADHAASLEDLKSHVIKLNDEIKTLKQNDIKEENIKSDMEDKIRLKDYLESIIKSKKK